MPNRKVAVAVTCQTCGLVWESVANTLPKWCEPCRKRRGVDVRRAKEEALRACQICGGPLPKMAKKFCDSVACTAELKRQRQEAARPLVGDLKKVVNRTRAPEGMGWCAQCKTFVPLGERARNGYCKPCARDAVFRYTIERKYGIDLVTYQRLLEGQDGRCAICQNRPKKQRLAVDHNHKTKEVRGLLCGRCNYRLLGSAHEKVELLQRAIAYLTNPPARKVLGE